MVSRMVHCRLKGTKRRLGATMGGTVLTDTRRRARATTGAVAAIVASLLLFPAPGAHAEEAELVAAQGSWFWSSNESVSTCLKDPVLGVCTGTSLDDGPNFQGIGATEPNTLNPISLGHLGVSLKNGSSDMRSYVKFDLGELPFGVEFDSFVVKLTVAQPTDQEHAQQHGEFGGKPPATSNDTSASILACAVTVPWGPAEGDPPFSTEIQRAEVEAGETTTEVQTSRNEPLFDCGDQALGVPNKARTVWSFDITSIAKRWASLELFNEGIALVPQNEDLAATWTVEFHGPPRTAREDDEVLTLVPDKLAARAEVSFVQVEQEVPPTQGPAGPPGPPAPAPPAFQPPFGEVTPDTDPPQPTGSLVRVSNRGEAETPGILFGLIPLGLLGLALVSNVLASEAAAVGGGGNRVAQVLKVRRSNGGAGSADLPHP